MKPTKKIIFIAFLLSLLFHFGSIIYIWIQSSFAEASSVAKAMEDKSANKQPINKQKDEWVEAKARASNFGTPVYFQDDFEPPQIESTIDSIEEIDKPEQPTESEQPDLQEEQIKEITEIQKPVEEKKEEIKITEIKPENKLLAKKTSSQKLPQSILRQAQDERKVNRPLAAPKPPLTLSQLTQGFLNHVKDEGKHAIHMLGKKSGTPSDEQIKYERYLQKLSWCLQNSFVTNNKTYLTVLKPIDTEVHLFFALNRDASIKHLQIIKSSQNKQLDEFFMSIFRDASTSFPPIPNYLPDDPFAMTLILPVHITETSGFSAYTWHR